MSADPVQQLQSEAPRTARDAGGAPSDAATYLVELRTAINGLGLIDLAETKLKMAQRDIDDVNRQTRDVADLMLETAENLIGAPTDAADYRSLVEQRMIELMEASAFQDLTGQRLSRIMKTLQGIEERLKLFAAYVHAQDGEVRLGTHELLRQTRDVDLMLSGPGAPGAMSQDGIDELIRLAG